MINNTSNIDRMIVKEKHSTWEGLFNIFNQVFSYYQEFSEFLNKDQENF